MADTREALIGVTDSIELELRRLTLWGEVIPEATALASPEPFCYDTLDFPTWMQWIFLPRMREAFNAERDMPERSNIFAYAEEALRQTDVDTDQLLFLIKTFDELVAAGSNALLPAIHQSSSKKLLS
ncbi:MAG: YqcC family protein [Pseudomonadota bacterium]